MRKVLLLVAVLLLIIGSSALAAEWIAYPELQGGGWTTISGAGYNGADAYEASGPDGVRRAIWKFEFADMPTTATLFEVYVYAPTGGNHAWQPVETQFNGSAGDVSPMDPSIPWAGAYGTNHQYLGNDWNVAGTWMKSGPGPQGPDSADYNAGPGGTFMWMKQGSWLYSKWDFGWSIDNTVSAVKIVAVPEPGSLVALAGGLLGLAGTIIRRRR